MRPGADAQDPSTAEAVDHGRQPRLHGHGADLGGDPDCELSLHGAPFLRGTIQPKGVETAAHTFLRERADELAPSGGFAIARANSSPRFPSALPPGQLMQPGIHDLQFYSVGDARTLQPVRALLEKHHAELGLTPDDGQRITGKGYLIETLPAALVSNAAALSRQ